MELPPPVVHAPNTGTTLRPTRSNRVRATLMGWSIGYDENWKRDIGYGVPCECDYPECSHTIDRGLSFVCGGDAYGGEHGCGLFFCSDHRHFVEIEDGDDQAEVCERCRDGLDPFPAKADTAEWINWKLTHDSWAQWRNEHPDEVAALRRSINSLPGGTFP